LHPLQKAGKQFNIPILYHPLEPMPSLQQQLGQIDIYLFDQLLRGNIMPGMRVLDAGCGPGRNLVYLLREGYVVFASDQSPEAIAQTRALAASLAPDLPPKTFASKPSNPFLTPTTPSTSSSAAPSSTLPETTRTSTLCFEISGVS
jgi:SAM-dependent methyltransferase